MNYITVDVEKYFKDGLFFYMDKCDYKDYQAIKYHCHEFVEIAYVYRGKGVHVINGIEYPVSKGDLFIINIEVPHSFYPTDKSNSEGLTVMNCIFMPQFLKNMDIELPILKEIVSIFLYKSFFIEEVEQNADVCFSGESSEDINRIFDKMFFEYRYKKAGYEELLRVSLCELLIRIYRCFNTKFEASDRCAANKYKFIECAIKYLEENYSRKINIDEISRQVYMSKSYFSYIFKEVTNMSIIEYLQKIRIEKACEYLQKESNQPISNIAYRVGYGDYKFFNKVFKKVTGMTAKEYREKYGPMMYLYDEYACK